MRERILSDMILEFDNGSFQASVFPDGHIEFGFGLEYSFERSDLDELVAFLRRLEECSED